MNQNRAIRRAIRALGYVLFFLIIQIAAIAQSTADSLLPDATLDRVIGYALKRQPQVQQSVIDENITALQIKSRLADWYPQINFNYLYQHNFQVQTNIIGGNPVQLGVNNTSAVQLMLSQNIFNRDVLLANRTKEEVQQLARQQTTGTRIELVSTVTKAFYDVLATELQISVVNENIQRLERSLKDARAQYDAGLVDKTDYKRATIALNNARASLKGTQESLSAKKVYLKALINYPSAEELEIRYDTTTLEREIMLDTVSVPVYNDRIEYQILETQKKLQEANVKYNKWSYIPTVSANAAYIRNFLSDDFSKLYSQSFPNSYAGITLGFPIFQGGKRKYNIKAAEWQLRRTELDIDIVKNNVDREYAAAISSYKASLANYLAVKENVELAEEVYDVINLQYRAGVKTYLEVITAETDLRTAQINYYNALYQVLSSKTDVQRSRGDIIPATN